MQNQMEYKLINNFKCKRCGCTKYDKLIYTGLKTLDEENAIIAEKYVCRNCDFPCIIDSDKNITITPEELLNQSVFIDEGTEIINNEKGEALHE